MKSLRTAALPLAIALAVPALGAQAWAQTADPAFAATTLDLSAMGQVKATPDRAALNLGVASQALTAAEALRDNSVRMNAVIAALKQKGVAERAIRTQGLNVQAQYAYAQGQPQRLTGYRASNMVTVTVDEIDRLGGLLDAAVAAGANEVNGVSFSLKDPAAAEDQARQEAVKALRAKAELYAQATGYRVGRLVRLSEGQPAGGGPIPLKAMVAVSATRRGPIPPVAAGEMDVQVQVNALYELVR